MANLQLLLSIGIPALLIVLSWIQQGTRMARIEAQIDTLRSDVNRDFAQLRADVNRDISAVRSEMISLRDSIHRDMVTLHERVAVVESKQA